MKVERFIIGLVVLAVALALALFAGRPQSAAAALVNVTLDQSQLAYDDGFNMAVGGLSHSFLAQSFTVGKTGYLDRVELLVGPRNGNPGDLVIEIQEMSGGVPSGTVLASKTIPESTISGRAMYSAVFDTPPAVTAGTQYAVVYSTPAAANAYYDVVFKLSSAYTGGDVFAHFGTDPWTTYSDRDLAFKTYVGDMAILSSNADLSALTLSKGTLSPAFGSTTLSYSASVSAETGWVTVTPTAADSGASVYVDGYQYASGSPSDPVKLNLGSNSIVIDVTAEDGVTSKQYTITVVREMPASGYGVIDLESLDGNLDPLVESALEAATSNYSFLRTTGGGYLSRTVPAGSYTVLSYGTDSAGTHYAISHGTVQVNNQTIVHLTSEPFLLQSQLLTVHAMTDAGNVSGAQVALRNSALSRDYSKTFTTNASGYASIYVSASNAETYDVLVAGTNPKVLGTALNLAPGATTHHISFPGTSPVFQLQMLDAAGNPATGSLSVWQGSTMNRIELKGSVAGDYLVASGSSLWLVGSLHMADPNVNTKTWTYHFEPLSGQTMLFQTGDPMRKLTAGGPLIHSIHGPNSAQIGNNLFHTFRMATATAKIQAIYSSDSSTGFADHYPVLEVKDPSNVTVSSQSSRFYISWAPQVSGAHTVQATLSDGGPFFGASVPSATMTVTVAPSQSFTLNKAWVPNTGQTVTATFLESGSPVSGVPVSLPPGSKVGGVGTSTASTNASGQVTFEVNLPQGGQIQNVTAHPSGYDPIAVPLLISDQNWGVIRLSISGAPATSSSQLRILQLASNGIYRRYDNPLNVSQGGYQYLLTPTGQVGITATPSGYYLAYGNLTVNANSETPITFDTTMAVDLTIDPTLDGSTPTVRIISAAPMGLHSRYFMSGSTVKVMPGTYGYVAGFNPVQSGPTYLAMEPGFTVSTTASVHNTAYTASQFGSVTPVFSLGDGTVTTGVFWIERGTAGVGFITGVSTEHPMYFLGGSDYVVREYDVRYLEAEQVTFRYRFERPAAAITITAGADNPGVWQDFGSYLSPALNDLGTGPARPGMDRSLEFVLTNAVGDRLVAANDAAGVSHTATLTLENAGGRQWTLPRIHFGGPAHVKLPRDLAAGDYWLHAALPGPYSPTEVTGSMLLTVEPHGVVAANVSPSNAGPQVLPGGKILVEVMAGTSQFHNSYTLNLKWDDTRASFSNAECRAPSDQTWSACSDMGVSISPTMTNAVSITRTGTTTPPVVRLHLQAQPQVSGPFRVIFEDSSNVFYNGSALQGWAFVGGGAHVAATGLTGRVMPIQNPYADPIIIRITNGQVSSVSGGLTVTMGTDADGNYWLFDYPAASPNLTVIAMAPGMLSDERTIAGSGLVPDMDLKWGDLNTDLKVDRADVNIVASNADRVNNGGPIFHVISKGEKSMVDAADLFMVARSYKHMAATPTMTVRGSVNLTVKASAANPDKALLTVWVPIQQAGSTYLHPIQYRAVSLNAGADTPLTISNLPLGPYFITVTSGSWGVEGHTEVPPGGSVNLILEAVAN